MAAFEIIALDPVTPQLRAPGGGDTYIANRAFDIEPGTLTSAIPVLDMGVTWNNAGTTFTGMRFNVTDTASNAASLLADFRVGSVSVLSVSKRANVLAAGQGSQGSFTVPNHFFAGNPANAGVHPSIQSGISLASYSLLQWTNSSATYDPPDLILARDAANTLAQRNGTAAQTFRIYNTFTDASNYERGFMRWASNTLEIGAEAAGTGTARNTAILANGVQSALFSSGFTAIAMAGANTDTRWFSGAMYPLTTNVTDTGTASNRWKNSFLSGFCDMQEIADPAAGAVNTGRIYTRDNGSGKTQLCVRFATGAVQVLATEP